MIVYKHKIWLRNAQQFVESKLFESLKIVALFIGLFGIILVFTLKITSTINKGIETQERTDKIAAEVAALEKENKSLQYTRDLYTSQSEIEAQYRELENKKKPDESVYIVSIPQKKPTEPSDTIPQKDTIPVTKEKNWIVWLEQIFR